MTWYHPAWYDRYVPDPDIEGEQLDQRLGARHLEDHETEPTPS